MFVKELGKKAGVPSVYTLPFCMLGQWKLVLCGAMRERLNRVGPKSHWLRLAGSNPARSAKYSIKWKLERFTEVW